MTDTSADALSGSWPANFDEGHRVRTRHSISEPHNFYPLYTYTSGPPPPRPVLGARHHPPSLPPQVASVQQPPSSERTPLPGLNDMGFDRFSSLVDVCSNAPKLPVPTTSARTSSLPEPVPSNIGSPWVRASSESTRYDSPYRSRASYDGYLPATVEPRQHYGLARPDRAYASSPAQFFAAGSDSYKTSDTKRFSRPLNDSPQTDYSQVSQPYDALDSRRTPSPVPANRNNAFVGSAVEGTPVGRRRTHDYSDNLPAIREENVLNFVERRRRRYTDQYGSTASRATAPTALTALPVSPVRLPTPSSEPTMEKVDSIQARTPRAWSSGGRERSPWTNPLSADGFRSVKDHAIDDYEESITVSRPGAFCVKATSKIDSKDQPDSDMTDAAPNAEAKLTVSLPTPTHEDDMADGHEPSVAVKPVDTTFEQLTPEPLPRIGVDYSGTTQNTAVPEVDSVDAQDTSVKKNTKGKKGKTSRRGSAKTADITARADFEALKALEPNEDVAMTGVEMPTTSVSKAGAATADESGANTQGTAQNERCGKCQVAYNEDDDGGLWIACDMCSFWYHAACVGLAKTDLDKIDKFHCPSCVPVRGPSTFKRTSGRAHTAIDYNALHNGSSVPIKNPVNSSLHPYIDIIRNRTKPFVDSKFKNMNPADVTTEALDYMLGGWNEPFVVPAAANPAPWRDDGQKPQAPESAGSDPTATRIPTPPPVPQSSEIDPRCRFPSPQLKPLDSDRRELADGLGMVIPSDLTVRRVGELIGFDKKVEVIDVVTQMTTKEENWNMGMLVEYFENPAREKIYNCISCEVSSSPLGKMISRPQVVRETDLVDRVWRTTPGKDPPTVGKYVLMSVADSYTDFHIDFAGSSVFYHIYEGAKVFLVMKPTAKALKAYEQWCSSPNMNGTWFPDLVPDEECIIINLYKGDTMFIPSGWIHAVYTPVDSLVVGGNFLTRNHYENQMKVHNIELITDVKVSQRYPKYTTLMFHVMYDYMSKDILAKDFEGHLGNGDILKPKLRGYGFRDLEDNHPKHKLNRTYSRQELEGLPYLVNFFYRIAGIHGGWINKSLRPGEPKLSQKSVEGVKRSIPDPFRYDPFSYVKLFAKWSVWVRAMHNIVPAGEALPEWANDDWVPPQTIDRKAEAALKKQQKEAEDEARRAQTEARRPGLRERARQSATPAPLLVDQTGDLFRMPETKRRTSDTPAATAAPRTGSTSSKRQATTPAAKPKPANGTSSQATKKRRISEPNPSLPAKKRKSTGSHPDKPSKSKSKSKNKDPTFLAFADDEKIILSDGSLYLFKSSNLGPPRTGCDSCRRKKTRCRHTEEIKAFLAQRKNGIKAEVVREKPEKPEDESPPGIPNGVEEHDPAADGDAAYDAADESEGDEAPAVEPDASSPPKAGEEVADVPAAEPMQVDPVPDQVPASAPAPPSVLPPPPAEAAEGTSVPHIEPVPVFKGRKPSCPECKKLKKKCPHEYTWQQVGDKKAAREAKKAHLEQQKAERRHKKEAKRRASSVEHRIPIENTAPLSTLGDKIKDAEVFDTISVSKPEGPTATVPSPSASSREASPLPQSAREESVQRPSPAPEPDTAHIVKTWDASGILEDHTGPAYRSPRATSTPEDAAIMAPPMNPEQPSEDKQEKEPTPASSPLSTSPSSRSSIILPIPPTTPTSSRKKSKGPTRTYTSTTKTIKRKAGENEDGNDGDVVSQRKVLKQGREASPGSPTGTDSLDGEFARALAFGLRNRKPVLRT